MSKQKYALLVIDMQLVAFDGKITPPITKGAELLQTISALICTCRSIEIPIVFLQTCAFPGQPYAKDMHGWEIHPDVSPAGSDRIVYKVQSNGFEDTKLQEVLTQIGVDTLITCGIWSEYCVTATGKAALERGYSVWIASDGHSTVAQSDESASRIVARQNDELFQRGALTLSLQDIKDKLEASYATD